MQRTMTMTLALVALALLAGCSITIANWPTPAACPTCAPCATSTGSAEPTVTVTPTATRVTPTPVVQQVLFDSRLSALNVKIEPLANAKFRLVAVWMTENGQWDGVPSWAWQYVDKINGAGGETHAFAGVYDAAGAPIVGKTIVLYWPDGNDVRVTEADGWNNWFVNAKYYPDQGQTGPYWFAPLKGDVVRGAGLPYGRHVSLFAAWQEVAPMQAPTLIDVITNWFWGG